MLLHLNQDSKPKTIRQQSTIYSELHQEKKQFVTMADTGTMVAAAASLSKPANKHRTWDENYAELLVYKQMYGNCDVPYGYKRDPVLGKWISHLRENQDQPLMSAERKAGESPKEKYYRHLLESYGFCFSLLSSCDSSQCHWLYL